MWVSYCQQLWPGKKYQIRALTNNLEEAKILLDGTDWKIRSFLGMNKTIKTVWKQLHQTFKGIFLPSLPVEQLICCLNLLLQHWLLHSSAGRKLKKLHRLLHFQIGSNICPVGWDYHASETWITPESVPGHRLLVLSNRLKARAYRFTQVEHRETKHSVTGGGWVNTGPLVSNTRYSGTHTRREISFWVPKFPRCHQSP